MMAEKFHHYEPAEYLEAEEDIRHYLEACQEDGDPALIAVALGDIARARNMSRPRNAEGPHDSGDRRMDERKIAEMRGVSGYAPGR